MRTIRVAGAVVASLLLLAHARADEPGGPSIEIQPAGCASCGSGLLSTLREPSLLPASLSDESCACCGSNCVPGRTPCAPCEHKGPAGRFLCALYECICCPDPCYEGKWYPLADSAFFCEAVRPVTQTRLRYDSGQDFRLPDRSEFYWARADGRGKGPRPVAPFLSERSLRHNDLVMVTEGGNGALSAIVETRYRNQQADLSGHAAGFTDLVIGTKTLLFDCELLQLSMLFKTHLPTGQFLKGLGTGHVSLEPGLLLGVKLAPTTYFQGQLSQWIPLGGDPAYQGSVLHWHTSLNQELCRIVADVPLIATAECVGYSFQDGLYTDPLLGVRKSSGESYVYLGGGLRLFVCDKLDIGFGARHAITERAFERTFYTAEFRFRF